MRNLPFILLLSLAFSVSVAAQPSPTPAVIAVTPSSSANPVKTPTPQEQEEQDYARHFDDQVKNILNKVQEIDEFRNQMESVAKTRRAAIELRIIQRSRDVLKLVNAVTDSVVKRESKGHDVSQYRQQLKPLLMPLGPRVRRAIINKELEVENNYASIDSLSEEGIRLQRESHNFINMALEVLSEHVSNLEKLKLDNEYSRSYLSSELERRAEMLLGDLELIRSEQDRLSSALASHPGNQTFLDKMYFFDERFNQVTNSLNSTIFLLEENGLETARYKQEIILATGRIRADILNPEVFRSLLNKWAETLYEKTLKNSADIVFKTLVFIFVLFVFGFIASIVKRLLAKSIEKAKLNISSLAKEMVIGMTGRVIVIFGILLGLSQLGISLGPVLAGLGIVGFIVGFALQDTLGNFASGIMILIYRPYDVGDMVEAAGGVFGKVKSMNLVSTTILTIDNQTLVVPNNKIWGDVIKNVTDQRVRRVDMVFSVSYSDDVIKVEKVIWEVIHQCEKVLKSPEPQVQLHKLNDSSIDFIVRPWVKTDYYWDVYWEITKEMKLRFDREGITIPFPQREVHLRQG